MTNNDGLYGGDCHPTPAPDTEVQDGTWHGVYDAEGKLVDKFFVPEPPECVEDCKRRHSSEGRARARAGRKP